MWFVLCSLPLLFLPLWEAYKPVREFAALIQSKYQPGDYAGYYKYSAPSLGFYMKEPIFEIIWEDQIIYFLSTNPRRIFCVIQDDDWRAIQPYIKRKYFILAARPRINLKLSALFAPLSHSQVPQVFLISNSP
jgi:hypothetical protein